jgi:hypothetical protein
MNGRQFFHAYLTCSESGRKSRCCSYTSSDCIRSTHCPRGQGLLAGSTLPTGPADGADAQDQDRRDHFGRCRARRRGHARQGGDRDKADQFQQGRSGSGNDENPPFAHRKPIFVGDDTTDESVFKVLPMLAGIGYSGERLIPGANGTFDSSYDVRSWLARLSGRKENNLQ